MWLLEVESGGGEYDQELEEYDQKVETNRYNINKYKGCNLRHDDYSYYLYDIYESF